MTRVGSNAVMFATFVVATAVVFMTGATARATVAAGQIDTFQNNDTSSWGGGDNATIQSGGMSGAGDLYLHLESFGGGSSGSKLSTFNAFQWSGDYAAAGITGIAMDLLDPNTSPVATPLNMRIVLFGAGGSRWSSAVGTVIPADNQWHHAVFSTAQADLVSVAPGDTYDQMLQNVTQLMVRYDAGASPSNGGTTFAGTLGIDNVTALPVPEPGDAGVFAGGMVILLMAGRRTRSYGR